MKKGGIRYSFSLLKKNFLCSFVKVLSARVGWICLILLMQSVDIQSVVSICTREEYAMST